MTRQQKERIHYLLLRFMASEASAGERMELAGLLKDEGASTTWEELLEEIYSGEPVSGEYDEKEWQPLLEQLLERNREGDAVAAPQIKGKAVLLRRIAVAASVVLFLAIGSYFLFFNKKGGQPDEIVKTEPAKDVKAPETNRATIRLANGNIVYLDSASNGQLAVQGNIKLVKLANGQIAYQTASGEIIKELQYNTLSNPRGSKVIDMTFADGSHVWLNAGSSVTYPVAFIGNERKVSITGEAYFEVAHNVTMPFKVSKGSMTVEVLGTHFNVNAYDDEDNIKVTLLEGSVNVKVDQNSLTIKPNQQAIVANSSVTLNPNVDVEAVMAWKNGRFQFAGAGIEEVMRQIARWYDVEVVYEVKPKEAHFGGGISRDVEVSKVFKMLETMEVIHFRIEGKKVFVIR